MQPILHLILTFQMMFLDVATNTASSVKMFLALTTGNMTISKIVRIAKKCVEINPTARPLNVVLTIAHCGTLVHVVKGTHKEDMGILQRHVSNTTMVTFTIMKKPEGTNCMDQRYNNQEAFNYKRLSLKS